MPNDKRLSAVYCDLVLEVAGVRYQCVAASTNFFINRIPYASVSLAVGRDAATLERAAIHDRAEDFAKLAPAKLWLNVKGEWSPADDGYSPGAGRWTEAGPQLIFEGYVTGFGYNKVHGSTRPTVSLIHWLSDLSFSSALSNQSHPSNPTRFRWRAVRGAQGLDTDARSHFIHSHVSGGLFHALRLQEDFWGRSLHPFFCELSAQDVLHSIALDKCVGLDQANTASQDALRRFEIRKTEKEVVGATCKEGSSSPFWKPLTFGRLGDAPAAIAGIIADTIAQDVRRGTEESYFSSTVWDKLISEFAPSYAFAVVPKVSTVQIVPYVPGLRQTFAEEFKNGKDLDLRDLSYISTSCFVPRPIRAVGVLQGGLASQTGIPEFAAFNVLGGCYAPDPDAQGMIMYKRPPAWLVNVPFYADRVDDTAFDQALTFAATTPMAPPAPATTAKTTLSHLRNYYNDAAQYLYAQEMLRGRQAMCQGKLRFDLAPGTTVGIGNQDPLFIPDDKLSQHLVADVSSVGIAVDAETQTAGTVFQLEHLRTRTENEDARTSIERHPFYDSVFTGAPLVNDYLFPE
jgi:hypothetical protein